MQARARLCQVRSAPSRRLSRYACTLQLLAPHHQPVAIRRAWTHGTTAAHGAAAAHGTADAPERGGRRSIGMGGGGGGEAGGGGGVAWRSVLYPRG